MSGGFKIQFQKGSRTICVFKGDRNTKVVVHYRRPFPLLFQGHCHLGIARGIRASEKKAWASDVLCEVHRGLSPSVELVRKVIFVLTN